MIGTLSRFKLDCFIKSANNSDKSSLFLRPTLDCTPRTFSIKPFYYDAERMKVIAERRKANFKIAGYLRVGAYDEIQKIFDQMRRTRVLPNETTYANILISYRATKKPSAYFVRIITEITRRGLPISLRIHSLVISGFILNKELDKLEVYLKHLKRRIRWDQYVFNQVLEAYANVGDTNKVLQLLKDMVHSGFTPDKKTYWSFINTFAVNKDVEKMMQVYQEMLKKGLGPNLSIINKMLQTLKDGGKHEEMITLFDSLPKHNLKPDTNTFVIMMSVHGEEKNEKFFGIINKLNEQKKDWLTKEEDYYSKMKGLLEEKNTLEAIHVFKQMDIANKIWPIGLCQLFLRNLNSDTALKYEKIIEGFNRTWQDKPTDEPIDSFQKRAFYELITTIEIELVLKQ